jgi:hypothetical protein
MDYSTSHRWPNPFEALLRTSCSMVFVELAIICKLHRWLDRKVTVHLIGFSAS